MDINLELYKVFYFVATSSNFSEAAKKLFISQSAVSQSIKTLESKLGTTLFFRNTKKVSLSKEGELLFKHIEPAFNLIKTAERNISDVNTFTRGEIHIGASDTICKYYLLPYFKQFHKLYPHIHIEVTNRTSTKCVDLLKQSKVDLIITNLPNEDISSYMEIRTVSSFKDVFVASSNFINLKEKEISIKELENHPLLMLEKNTTTRVFFDNFIKNFNFNIKPDVELGSIDLLIELARISLGISFVPDYCFNDTNNLKDLFILNIKEQLPIRKLAVVTNKNIPLSVASKKFIELMD